MRRVSISILLLTFIVFTGAYNGESESVRATESNHSQESRPVGFAPLRRAKMSSARTYAVLDTGPAGQFLPNLIPFAPEGWSAPIVVSTSPGTNTDSSQFASDDDLFLDWAVGNAGEGDTQETYLVSLFVDDTEVGTWFVDPPHLSFFFIFVEDFNIGSLPPGTHQLVLVADIEDDVFEEEEDDNVFIRTIEVEAPGVIEGETIDIFFPSLLKGAGGLDTGIALANPTDEPATVEMFLVDNAGDLVPTGTGPTGIINPAVFEIPANRQVAQTVGEIFGTGAAGLDAWALARSTNLGVVGFFLTFDNGVANIDGAEAVSRGSATVVFPQILAGPGEFTELNIVSLGGITLELRGADGNLIETVDIQLPEEGGRFSNNVSNIFSTAIPGEAYVLARSQVTQMFGYENFGSANFRGGRNAIPVEEFARDLDVALLLAQLADSPGVLTSTLTLINPTGTPAELQFSAFRTGQTSRTPAATAHISLVPRSIQKLDARTLLGLPPGTFVGWLRIDSDISGPVGDITFQDPNEQYLAAVALQRAPLTDMVFAHLADGFGFFTGLTFLNIRPDPVEVRVEVFNNAGAQTGAGSFTLGPFEHRARLLPEIIPGFQPQVGGNIRARSNTGTFGFELFSFAPGGVLQSLAAVPPQRGSGNLSGQLTVPMIAHLEAVALGPYPASAAKRIELDPDREFVPGQVIVKYRPTTGTRSLTAMKRREELEVLIPAPGDFYLLGSKRVDTQGLQGLPATSNGRLREHKLETLQLVDRLNADPNVLYAEPNYIYRARAIPNDPLYGQQWHYEDINLPAAWDITTGDPNITVAVLDTGARFDHPDLGPRLTGGGMDFVSDPVEGLDGDGIDSDPTDPGDDPNGLFSGFHGTHVAGTIGAVTNNGAGVAGVNWVSPLMILRVLGKGGSGTTFDIAQAILYAARLPNSSQQLPAKKANVINLSLGAAGISEVLCEAVAAAVAQNVVVVTAAGNENTSGPVSPADCDGANKVGATDLSGGRAPYSNFGPRLNVVAPGGNTGEDRNGDGFNDGVLSTMWNQPSASSTFTRYQGTSMASPHVAGVVSLILSVNPNLTPAQVLDTLQRTAIDLGPPGKDNTFGFGKVNTVAALQDAGGPVGIPPRIVVSTTSFNFANTLTQQTLTVSNGGGGTLVVDDPTVQVDQGSGWLVPSLSGATMTVRVNRGGLTDGMYTGRVQLSSNGGNATVEVAMEVGGSDSVDVGEIVVLVLDPVTFETLGQGETNLGADYRFLTDPIPAGNYLVVAGTDTDGNNFICEQGDFCGFFPTLNEPELVRIEANKTSGGVDFVVQTDTGSASLQKLPKRGFRLLRKLDFERLGQARLQR